MEDAKHASVAGNPELGYDGTLQPSNCPHWVPQETVHRTNYLA